MTLDGAVEAGDEQLTQLTETPMPPGPRAPADPHQRSNGDRGSETLLTTIAIPVLNEELYIEACITSLLAQADCGSVEVLVVDGGSTDRTLEVVGQLQTRYPCIRVIHNPARIQSAGMNLAAAAGSPRSRVLVRADAHAIYPADFIRKCLIALEQSGATSVVVPMQTVGHDGFQRAVAATQNSRLGNGGSAHRSLGASRFVDHGHHAVFDRAFFLSMGGYNESFTHNEDAEFDYRAGLSGGRAWLCTEAAISYFPRRDPIRLAKQYRAHGRGRARTLLTHGIRPRLRQLAPLLILLAAVGGLALAPVSPVFAVPLVAYLLLSAGWGVAAAVRRHDVWLLAMGAAATIMHLSWAVGFLSGCLNYMRLHAADASGPTAKTPGNAGVIPSTMLDTAP